MKRFFSLSILLFLGVYILAQQKHNCQEKHDNSSNKIFYESDSRSDSIDITHIQLDLDFHQLDGILEANATIEFTALVNNIELIKLDLLNFTIDSIIENGSLSTFDYNNELLQISIANSLQIDESTSVVIYYHGEPTTDGSGFGGLDYVSGYAYNMGVGFLADPHPFGRSWFPCFDNFVERSTYSFNVLTDSSNFAYCNGEFISRVEIGEDSLITSWEMDNTIPSYLASIGVAPYSHVEQLFEGIVDDIPVFLIAKPVDTTNMKNSFINLSTAFSTYENRFGPYRWNKVGFNLVPNNGGAMEHATNIAYPKILANGSTDYQAIMAHELAHHWWGDLVTCSTQEDMWINEGMASYCEQLFFESLGGEDAYIEKVRNNHESVFFEAHLNDGAWLPVSGIGTENTYGYTVYLKGSDVAHVLRSYLEDEDFFEILTSFLDENQYSDVSSEDFRDYIIASGTDANIMAYFENWIFNAGFPSFEINTQEIIDNGSNFTINLSIVQQLHHAPELYTDVPMFIQVVDELHNTEDFRVVLSGEMSNISITTTLNPKEIYLNPKDRISQGVFGDNFEIEDTGTTNLSYSDFRVKVNELGESDTYWFRTECHYGDADIEDETTNYKVSNDRFWRVRMFGTTESQETDIEGLIKFNGNENSSNYRDETFFIELENLNLNEDSLVLMYRENGEEAWEVFDDFEIATGGSNTNWIGSIKIYGLKSGDYTWGYLNPDVSLENEPLVDFIRFEQNNLAINIDGIDLLNYNFTIYDSVGRTILSEKFTGSTQILTEKIASGSYVLKVISHDVLLEESFHFNIAK